MVLWYLLRLSRHDDVSDVANITTGSSIGAKTISDGEKTSDGKRTHPICFQAKIMEQFVGAQFVEKTNHSNRMLA
jgi:hypothetical protein